MHLRKCVCAKKASVSARKTCSLVGSAKRKVIFKNCEEQGEENYALIKQNRSII